MFRSPGGGEELCGNVKYCLLQHLCVDLSIFSRNTVVSVFERNIGSVTETAAYQELTSHEWPWEVSFSLQEPVRAPSELCYRLSEPMLKIGEGCQVHLTGLKYLHVVNCFIITTIQVINEHFFVQYGWSAVLLPWERFCRTPNTLNVEGWVWRYTTSPYFIGSYIERVSAAENAGHPCIQQGPSESPQWLFVTTVSCKCRCHLPALPRGRKTNRPSNGSWGDTGDKTKC